MEIESTENNQNKEQGGNQPFTGSTRKAKRPRTEDNQAQQEGQKHEEKTEDGVVDDNDNVYDDQTNNRIPTFEVDVDGDIQISSEEFLEVYQLYQVVHFKNINWKKKKNANGVNIDIDNNHINDNRITASSTCATANKAQPNGNKKATTTTISWKDIGSVYEDLEETDQNSWCIENGGNKQEEDEDGSADATQQEQQHSRQHQASLHSKAFLQPEITNHRAYCSFLVQQDKHAYDKLLERLPVKELSCHSTNTIDYRWSYEPCLWIFFGRNNNNNSNNKPLEGRGLHTDSVSHDGTWHYQLSGTKIWYLKPSCDFTRHYRQRQKQKQQRQDSKTGHQGNDDDKDNEDDLDSDPFVDESTQIKIICRQGDVIVINTRLWFHRTVIPYQPYPSVSYARDFRLPKQEQQQQQQTTASADDGGATSTGTMTNVDGLYARNDIDAGTIIFTETDMPDCELHRSNTNPNCEVVELEDGTNAVVSKRSIACGEFFCVAESSSEEEDEDEDVDDDDDEEEEGFVDCDEA